MSAFNCPHCNQEGEEDYDNEQFFEDGAEIDYECGACEKTFRVNVSVTFDYIGICIDHEWGEYIPHSASATEHNEKMAKHAWCRNCGDCGDLDQIKEPV
jgi:transcription elongation factor Elf1